MSDVFHWLADEILRTRHAVYKNSHGSDRGKQWDVWLGREAWMAFKRAIPREYGYVADPAVKHASLVGAKIDSDAGLLPWEGMMCYRGAPVRRLDMKALTSAVIVDTPEALSVELHILRDIAKGPRIITAQLDKDGRLVTPHWKFVAAPPMRFREYETGEDHSKPMNVRTVELPRLVELGFVTVRPRGEHTSEIEITLIGKNALAQFDAWSDGE